MSGGFRVSDSTIETAARAGCTCVGHEHHDTVWTGYACCEGACRCYWAAEDRVARGDAG